MKKYLIMISSFLVTTISTNQLVESMISTNILKPIIKNENKYLKEFTQLNDEIEIDFNEVENYFKDEKNKTNNKFNGMNSSDTLKNKSQIDDVFAKALEYTREFKIENMSLDRIINKFKNENPKFNLVYQREINKITKNNFDIELKKIMNEKKLMFNNEDEKKLKLETIEFWNKLNDIKKGLSVAIVIAATTAAAMWAVAWLGGISVPWAVAATTAAATMGVILSALNIYLSSTHPYMDKILQGITITVNVGLLVYEFVSTVIKVFTIGTITLSASSVIMPAFTAVTAGIIALYYWVGQTSIFKQMENANNFDEAINNINESNVKYLFNEKYQANKNLSSIYKITKLLDWTKFASSTDEFKKNYKGLFFLNSKAFAGDSEDNKVLDNIIYNVGTIDNSLSESVKRVILDHIYDGWFCTEHDSLQSNIYFENNDIMAKFTFIIGTTCQKMNYVKLAYEGISLLL